jgi:protein TonB
MNTVFRFGLVSSLFLATLFPSGLMAQAAQAPEASAPAPAPSEEVVPIGPGVSPPRVLRQVQPDHPTKGFRISGSVLLSVIVSSKGDPKEPKVTRSLEKDLDQSAIDAVMKWQFTPAMKDGKPVASRVSIEIRFHDM